MKDNILGIILLAGILIGPPTAEAAETDIEQIKEELQVAYFCGTMYKTYGTTELYPFEIYELGKAILDQSAKVTEMANLDFVWEINVKTDSQKRVNEMVEKTPIIPTEIDQVCTVMAAAVGAI
jgi:hypothetical protein